MGSFRDPTGFLCFFSIKLNIGYFLISSIDPLLNKIKIEKKTELINMEWYFFKCLKKYNKFTLTKFNITPIDKLITFFGIQKTNSNIFI